MTAIATTAAATSTDIAATLNGYRTDLTTQIADLNAAFDKIMGDALNKNRAVICLDTLPGYGIKVNADGSIKTVGILHATTMTMKEAERLTANGRIRNGAGDIAKPSFYSVELKRAVEAAEEGIATLDSYIAAA